MPRDTLLHRIALAAHLGLALALALTLGSIDLLPVYRLAIIVPALLPLAAGFPGLLKRRRASLQWLTVALVLYAGIGAVEVIARSHPGAIVLLLLALLELALILRLTRAAVPR